MLQHGGRLSVNSGVPFEQPFDEGSAEDVPAIGAGAEVAVVVALGVDSEVLEAQRGRGCVTRTPSRQGSIIVGKEGHQSLKK